MSFFQSMADWGGENPGKIAGGVIGFVAGVLIFTLGIIQTLIVIAMVLVGYIIGKSRDDDISIIDMITGLFRRKRD